MSTGASGVATPIAWLFLSLALITCGDGGTGPTLGIDVSPSQVPFSADVGSAVDAKTVGITSSTGQLAGLEAAISYTGNPPSQWLSVVLDDITATLDDPAILTLQATATGLPPGTYEAVVIISSTNGANEPRVGVTFTITDVTPAQLSLSSQPPATVQNGQPFASVVQVQSASGNPVEAEGIEVTASVEGGPPLEGTTKVTTDPTGAANFPDLTVSGPAGPRTLVFTAPDLSEARSSSFSLVAGAAARIEPA